MCFFFFFFCTVIHEVRSRATLRSAGVPLLIHPWEHHKRTTGWNIMLFPSFYLIMWFIWKFWGELKGCMAAGKKTNVQEVMERSNTNIVIFLYILQIENNNSLLADKKILFASYFCAFLHERVRVRERELYPGVLSYLTRREWVEESRKWWRANLWS